MPSLKINRFGVNLAPLAGPAWSLAWEKTLEPWLGSEGGRAAID